MHISLSRNPKVLGSLKCAYISTIAKFFTRTVRSSTPAVKKIPVTYHEHGSVRVDELAWLQNPQDPDVKAYLLEENEYAQDFFDNSYIPSHENGNGVYSLQEVAHEIHEEIDSSASRQTTSIHQHPTGICIGDSEYVSQFEPGKALPCYYRRKVSTDRDLELVLDPNQDVSSETGFVALGQVRFSPDGKRVAYSVDTTGEEIYDLYIKDLCPSTDLFDFDSTQKSSSLSDKELTASRRILSDTVSFEWACGSDVMIYTKVDHTGRPYQVFSLPIQPGAGQEAQPRLILNEDDDTRLVDVNLTKDKAFALISSTSKTSTETYILPTNHPILKCLGLQEGNVFPDNLLTLVHPAEEGLDYCVEHQNGKFIIVSNRDNCPNYKVSICSLDANTNEEETESSDIQDRADRDTDTSSSWETLLPHQQNASIVEMDVFKNFIVLYQRDLSNGSSYITVFQVDNGETHIIDLPHSPDSVGVIAPGANSSFESDTVHFTYSSPIVPCNAYEYNLYTRDLVLVENESIKSDGMGDFDCKRLMIPSSQLLCGKLCSEFGLQDTLLESNGFDSHSNDADKQVLVPVTLVFQKENSALCEFVSSMNASTLAEKTTTRPAYPGKPSPLLVQAYGAYGTNADISCSIPHLSLVNRGWIYAIVHARGGAECGREWYQSGKSQLKQNTFLDVANAILFLGTTGVADRKWIAASGVSAGGLSIAAVINRFPGLIKAATLRVPFIDVLTSMMDDTLPLTKHEYAEWGNPSASVEVYQYIKQYCPYLNLSNYSNYSNSSNSSSSSTNSEDSPPSVYLTASVNDPRVPYWMPAKYVAKRRVIIDSERDNEKGVTSLLETSFGSGHFGDGDTASQYAKEFAFLISSMGVPFFSRKKDN